MSDARETRARRLAHRNGYMLRKSRIDGTWLIIDPERNWIVYPPNTQSNGAGGAYIDEVEAFLNPRLAHRSPAFVGPPPLLSETTQPE